MKPHLIQTKIFEYYCCICASFIYLFYHIFYSPEDNEKENNPPESPGGNCNICGQREPLDKKGKKRKKYHWGQCDYCDKWVHLEFCCPQKILKDEDRFVCPKCAKILKNEN